MLETSESVLMFRMIWKDRLISDDEPLIEKLIRKVQRIKVMFLIFVKYEQE
jgi:hypothetical protein